MNIDRNSWFGRHFLMDDTPDEWGMGMPLPETLFGVIFGALWLLIGYVLYFSFIYILPIGIIGYLGYTMWFGIGTLAAKVTYICIVITILSFNVASKIKVTYNEN